MTDQVQTVRSHRWEVAGLGIAPFRCTGMTEVRHDLGGGHSKPGGTCDYCGQGILYVFNIVSSDGRKFKVGCDCVAHTHDAAEQIVVQTKKLLKDYKRAKAGEGRAAKRKAEAAARQAKWDAERAANIERLATDALYIRLGQHAATNPFLAKLVGSMERFGALTEAQLAAAEKALDRVENGPARKAASRWLGSEGTKVKIAATVELSRCIYLRDPRDYFDSDRYLNKLRTDDGAAVVWFGSYGLTVGARIEGSATVKKLDEYEGEQQTTIRNPRWKA